MMEEKGRREGAVETGTVAGEVWGIQQDVWGKERAGRGERIDGGKEKKGKVRQKVVEDRSKCNKSAHI